LRSVADKLTGIFVLFDFIFVFFILPFYLTILLFRSNTFKPTNSFFFWSLCSNSSLLGWIGAMPVTEHYVGLGFRFTSFHFFLFLFCFPSVNNMDNFLYDSFFFKSNILGEYNLIVFDF
jgi:quinol-cytochrome oxidoreductase complex cytochrome b subunit